MTAEPWEEPAGGGEPRVLRLVDPPGAGSEETLQAIAQRFVQALVEIVEGDRSPGQLLRWTAPLVYEDLVSRMCARRRTSCSPRARLISVRVYHPFRGVAEVSAHVRHGTRSRALAVRMELFGGRWVCTAIDWD